MPELFLRKLYDTFVPVDKASAEIMGTLEMNSEFKAVLTKPRNIRFHKKFFALVNFAYEHWEMPVNEYKGVQINKNRERFRKDLTIMAGFGFPVVNVKGDVRYEAQSISFANMDASEFEQLYSRFIDVILQKILTGYTRDDLDTVVNKVLGFV